MADEQIIVDIEVNSTEVAQAEKRIDSLTDTIEVLGNRISTARKLNKEYTNQQKSLEKQVHNNEITATEYTKGIDKLNTKIKTNNKIIAESQIELSKERRERTANIKLVNTEANSRDQLRQKVAILSREYNELNMETREGRERSEQLQVELRDLNEELNRGSLAAGNFKDNIGNYPEVASGAVISLQSLGDGMDAVGGSSANAVGGIRSMGAAFKALLANPVVLVISLIVAGLVALFSAFKKSENGSKLLSKGLAGLRGLFSILIKFADTLAKALTGAFKDPQQAVEDLWDVIKKNIVNRFTGIIDLFVSLGKVIKSALTLNLEDLEQAAKDTNTALIQMGTGLDAQQQEDFANSIKETIKEAERLAAIFVKLEEAQRLSRSAARNLEKDIATLSAEFERLSEIAGDDTRNLHEMRQAAIDASNAAEELAEKQVKLAQTRLNIINLEVNARRSAGEEIEDLLDQQAQAEVALTDAKSQAAIAQQKILIEQRKIERDIFEQNLDILLDVGDKIKTEQEKQIQDESISLEKRKQLLIGSRVALAANFAEIKKEYELYGITAQQINEVINASDAKQANEKLKALGLNEIANNRLREIILERKQAELDFNALSKDLSDEEIERKAIANETIKEIQDEATVNAIEDLEKRNDKLIELEKEKLDKLLENDLLLIEERAALQAESDARIAELEEEKIEIQKEKDAENKERLADVFNEIASLTEDFAGAEAAIFGRISESIAIAFEDGVITASSALMGLSVLSNAIFAAMSQGVRNSMDRNEKARQAELELAGENEEAKNAINEKFDKKAAALKLKQFNADKAATLIKISIETALGVIKAAAALPIPPFPFAIAIGSLGLLQAGFVAASKPPQFGQGVNDIVSIGDSHASGNDVDVFGISGNQKQYFGKVEKGEAMPVIRKSSVSDYMVSQLNGKYSPKGRSFADGTPDITNQNQNQNNEMLVSQIALAFQDIRIVAKIEDITKQAGRKMEIVNNSKV